MRKLIAVLLFCAVNLTACDDSKPVVTSTLIINAQIHDGSGGEAIRAAVRIDGDRIIEIGEIEVLPGEDLIDARGMVLAPGFIDTHSHHDRGWQEYRHMPGVLSQGVTTIVRGDGIQVSADIYPYQRWASNLAVLFPARDYSDRSVADFTFEHTAAPEDIVLSYFGPNPEFNGLTVAAIASILEKDVATTLMELAQAADDYRNMAEDTREATGLFHECWVVL